MNLLKRLILPILLTGVAIANDPGGGAPGVGANVTLSSTSTTVTLSNGVITAVIQKSSGKVSSYLFNGTQMVDPANPIYYSMDGGASYEQPSNCVYSVTTQTADMVDVSFKRTWNNTSGYKHVFDIDLHYVLRRGDAGLYAYAILDHPASYPAASVGEWRIVWKLPRTSTTFHFERAYIDGLRNWEMPSYYDYQNASPTGIAEIVKLNTGVMAGKYDGKYTYAARYYDIGTWGHTGKNYKKGVWFVLGGHDYFNDGPTHQDLTSSESYILMHFGRNHYGGSGTSVAAGEAWRKMYGPFLLYCNGTTATTNPGDVLWADAKAQVEAEKAAWPYSWLVNTDHPAASGRGTVNGRLLINDPLKPAITGANAMVGLAAPEETHGNWQRQSKGYQYWTKADANGNFTIPAIRPGTYTLHAYTTGVVEEFSKTNVTVTAGATNAQGDLAWNIANPGTSIAWEIGVPDRTAKEFRHGNDYFTPYLWDVYPQEFPNPLVYNVGTSNPATDWNYVHSNYPGSTAGTTTGWNWDVNFNLPNVPRTGDATLTVAFAGAQYPRLFLYINGETSAFTRLSPTISGGNGLLRQGIHAKYSYLRIPIPVSRLRQGSNTFRFSFTGDSGFSPNVMYDYLSLHLPDFPPPPPDSGRAIVWAGGANAAANTWDTGSTLSFRQNTTPAAFGDGDAVTLNDAGSNSTPVTLAGVLQPNSVTIAGANNYNLTGTGELSGPMSLSKSGTSTLTISQANTWSGITEISGGVISLANDTANANGLGTSDVILKGGALRMFSNGATTSSASSFWNLDVPGGQTGTLETDWRCELRGKLTGSGTFRYRLPNGAVRSSIFGDWSGFSGVIEASTLSGSGEFRIAPDYSWPGLPVARLELGNNVTALWGGNLNSGTGSFVTIGELAGTASATLRGGSIGGRQLTYRIGARGGDATFAGTISEQTSGITNLVKQGQGAWTLSGSANINGELTAEAGTLALTGIFGMIAGKTARVLDSAVMSLDGTLNAETLRVESGGTLRGLGTLGGNLINEGHVELSTGSFDVTGTITNNGYFRILAPASLAATGTFTNTGVLNLIGSSQPIPPGIVNTGIILTDRAPTTLNWKGDSGTTWDLHTSVNWANTSSQPDVFFQGDAVVFDDSSTVTTVEIDGSLSPAAVTVSTDGSYSFTGGTLGGSGGLTKSGTGILTVTSALNLTGSISITGGTFRPESAAAWPDLSPLLIVGPSATLDVSTLPSGAVILPSQTLRGAGAVAGNASIQGTHDPGAGSAVSGSLTYAATARLKWNLLSNSNAAGSFDTVSAASATITPGAAIDLVFDEPGSTVDFSSSFWDVSRSWVFLNATTRSGSFTLGTVSADPGGRAAAAQGVFSIQTTGQSLSLVWTPIVPVAKWRGNSSPDWNLSTANWDISGTNSIYQNGIATRFDDGSLATSVNLAEAVLPGDIEFASSLNHSIGGAGSIGGSASLVQNGAGTLTLTSSNPFTGGTTIRSGILAITNASALGTGTVTLDGGRWETGALAPNNMIIVSADSTISGGSGSGLHGIKAVSGSGILTLEANNVFDLEGSMSSFTGTVRITGTNNVRFNGSTGSSSATFDLGTRFLQARNGGTYHLGALTGLAGSVLNITGTTSAVTFSVGANGSSSTFAGNVANGTGTLALTKTGAGTLTLAGTCSHTGTTTISAGTLKLAGSFGPSPLSVGANAVLEVSGAASATSLTMQSTSTLARPLGAPMGTLHLSGNANLAGNLAVSPQPGVNFGRFTILTHAGTRSGTLSLTGAPAGVSAQLVYATNEVVLYLDDTDQDGLPDSWEQTHFGNLSKTPSGDEDGDGQSNASEYLTGTNPASGASIFAATAVPAAANRILLTWPSVPGRTYRIESAPSPAGPWSNLSSTPAAASPAASTSAEVDRSASSGAFFYRIVLDP
jgi:rhamnogalacturonan endolyase